jgi:hypothetical protein
VNLLDRYIFKSVLGSCLAAVGLFAFVLMLGNALRDLLGYLLAGQITPATFAWLIVLLIPFVISYALPMGMLTGVLLTLGRLSADSEITAMRAAGLSLARIARPVILLGALGAAARPLRQPRGYAPRPHPIPARARRGRQRQPAQLHRPAHLHPRVLRLRRLRRRKTGRRAQRFLALGTRRAIAACASSCAPSPAGSTTTQTRTSSSSR